MFIYIILAIIAGILSALLPTIITKKAENVTYGVLDKVGRVTNILMTVAYCIFSPFYLAIGIISRANYGGILWVLGTLVALIIASCPIYCGIGIGASVALRKKGKSKLSFIVQFAGVVGIALAVVLHIIFYGNLLATLN